MYQNAWKWSTSSLMLKILNIFEMQVENLLKYYIICPNEFLNINIIFGINMPNPLINMVLSKRFWQYFCDF